MAADALVTLAALVKFGRRPVIQEGECAAAAMFSDIRKSFKMEAR
jgi:hypothetical protein